MTISELRKKRAELWTSAFSLRLSRMMEESETSIEELSRESGVSVVTIRRYLKGTSSPRASDLYFMAKALKSSFDDILGL